MHDPAGEPLRPGDFVGTDRFRVVEAIGRGGMGVVYRAHDSKTDREVALKTLTKMRVSTATMTALKQEFRLLAGILHPNLVELYDLVVDDSSCFFTMELLDGVSLSRHVRGVTNPDARSDTVSLPDIATADPRETRPPLTTDELRKLEDCIAQLVSGISRLHFLGKLHRDIKPSNVQVTSSGRVVLLDFGLAMEVPCSTQIALPAVAAGTPIYMAPEQLRIEPLTTAADWYAVGVVLYEMLTGRLPFHGDGASMRRAKAARLVTPPGKLAPCVPPGLESVVLQLLDPLPHRRAGAKEILAALGRPPTTAYAAASAPFVGRGSQLGMLWRAFDAARAGTLTVALVEGRSGMGKSEILRHFTAELESARAATVLRARCLPEELVPYRAIDAVVDQLAGILSTLPEDEVARISPPGAWALARLFAVLRQVKGFAPPAPHQAVDCEPREIRKLGFAALRDLLDELAKATPIVLCLDDLQWIDADCEPLLRHLLEPRPSAFFAILACRSEDLDGNPFLKELGAAGAGREPPLLVPVGPLEEAPAREVLSHLLGRRGVDEARVSRLVSESVGSPYFLGELARHSVETEGRGGSDLAAVVKQRIERLSEKERRFVELVSVAGRPTSTAVLLSSAGAGNGSLLELAHLSHACLLRRSGRDDAPNLEAYHDKVRETVLESMPPDRLRERHRQLAQALAEDGADNEFLALHYQGAGDLHLAASFARKAADAAAEKLAFGRAAELYERVLRMKGDAGDRGRLHELSAENWVNAGQGARAAENFEAAAGICAGEGIADALGHLRHASENYLRSGRIVDGMRILRKVAEQLRVSIPDTRLGAIAAMLPLRVSLLLHTFRSRKRPVAARRADVDRMDALWGASSSISMLNHVVADPLGVRHLLRAFSVGDDSRIARGLGYEAAFETVIGWRPLRWHASRLLGRMDEAIARSHGSYEEAWGLMAKGITAWFNAEWALSIRLCDEAARRYREECRGISWELAITDAYSLPALAYRGDIAELQRRVPRALAAAKERGDLFAANICRLGQQNLVWLAADRPDRALSEADAGLSELFSPVEASAAKLMGPLRPGIYLTPHYHHLFATVQADLYRGDAWSALRRVQADWPRLRSAMLLNARIVRSELKHLRARAALAAAAAALAGRTGHVSAARLVRMALSAARSLDRDSIPMARAFALAIRAGACNLREDGERSRVLLRAAALLFRKADMGLYGAAAQFAERPGRRRERAREWLGTCGVTNPAAMVQMLVPACADE